MNINILFRFLAFSHGIISLDGVAAVTVPIGESLELKNFDAVFLGDTVKEVR